MSLQMNRTRRQIIDDYLSLPANLNVFTTKKEGTLSLYSYQNSHPGISDVVRHLKGVIVDSHTGQVVACGPVIPDDINDLPDIDAHQDPQEYLLTEIIDGTQFRVYHLNDEWHVSTQGMIVPRRGFMGKRSFLELFTEASLLHDLRLDQLKPERVYVFMLRHPDEPIMTEPDQIELYLMDVLDQDLNSIEADRNSLPQELMFTKVKMPYREKFTTSSTLRQLAEYVETQFPSQVGAIAQSDMTPVRIEKSVYRNLKMLKGNCTDLRTRYLQLWQKGKHEPMAQAFPRMSAQIDAKLYRTSQQILTGNHRLTRSMQFKTIDDAMTYLQTITSTELGRMIA